MVATHRKTDVQRKRIIFVVKTFGKNYNEDQDIKVTQELQECQIHKQLTEKKQLVSNTMGWGCTPKNLGWGDVRPGSPNPYPISHQKMSFSTPVFRPDL